MSDPKQGHVTVRKQGRPLGTKNLRPNKGSKARFAEEVEEARRVKEIQHKDYWKVRKGRTTLYADEAEFTTEDLSELMRDYAGQNTSVQSLLKYYQDAKTLGAYGVVEECLVVARYTVGQEAKRSLSERNNRLMLTGLQIVANLARTLKDLEDVDKKVALIVQQRLQSVYITIANAIVEEIQDPVLCNRVIMRACGGRNPLTAETIDVESEVTDIVRSDQ